MTPEQFKESVEHLSFNIDFSDMASRVLRLEALSEVIISTQIELLAKFTDEDKSSIAQRLQSKELQIFSELMNHLAENKKSIR